MKHVNLDPELEKKKEEIMQQFREYEESASHAPAVAPPSANKEGAGGAPSAEALKELVISALKTVYDPEIPVNIFDLGLIYRVDVNSGFVEVDMTLTTPGCPVAQSFPGIVESTVRSVPGVTDAMVNLVWEPPWTQDLISEAARLELGLI